MRSARLRSALQARPGRLAETTKFTRRPDRVHRAVSAALARVTESARSETRFERVAFLSLIHI